MSCVPIIPSQISQTVSSITIQSVKVKVFNSAEISVMLSDSNNQYIANQTLEMNTNDYSLWGNDDNYLINWVLTQLGFQKALTSVSGTSDNWVLTKLGFT